MEKRTDAQVYVVGHKRIDYSREDTLYTPIQVGFSAQKLWDLRDNMGFNISEWNGLYAENTALYWIWKNRPSSLKYIGFVQYRRRLEFPEDTDFDALFSSFDAVTMTPLRIMVPDRQYKLCHCDEDIELAEGLIKERYPELAGKWDRIMKAGRDLLYSNGMILKAEDFDRYCEFLFDILEQIRELKGWDTPQEAKEAVKAEIESGKRKAARGLDYQAQVFGFLSERLWTFWCLSTFPRERILFKDYHKFEGV